MTRPQYTWYVEALSEATGGTGGVEEAWRYALMVPVGSDATVGEAVWYVTPMVPGGATSGSDIDVRFLGFEDAHTTATTPHYVDESGNFYGALSLQGPAYEWDSVTPYPAYLWRSEPIPATDVESPPTSPSGVWLSTDVVYPTTIADTEAQKSTANWSSRVRWDNGAVCIINSGYDWYSPSLQEWRHAVATDDVREGGVVRAADQDDQRPGAGTYYSGANVTFADGKVAAMMAIGFLPY